MRKLTKELLTGIVALGILAPVATSTLNPVNTTVNARRRTRRHYRRSVRRRGRRIRRRSHHSYRITGYANWFEHNSHRIYQRYHSSRSFMNGINDGLNGGNYNGGALLNMDSVNHSLYYKGWVIGNATARSDNYNRSGYVYSSPHNYNNAIHLYNQGKRYGDSTGNDYLQYNGSWSELGASNNDEIGYNTNVLATLYGNYKL